MNDNSLLHVARLTKIACIGIEKDAGWLDTGKMILNAFRKSPGSPNLSSISGAAASPGIGGLVRGLGGVFTGALNVGKQGYGQFMKGIQAGPVIGQANVNAGLSNMITGFGTAGLMGAGGIYGAGKIGDMFSNER